MRGNNGSTKKLLVVEDNECNQELIVRMARRLGYESHAVQSGTEALKAIVDGTYAVILMDCQLPSMSGYDVARSIRSTEGPNQQAPIVAITADLADVAAEEALSSGMNDFLSKPFELKDLEAKLNKWADEGSPLAQTVESPFRTQQLPTREAFWNVVKSLELENNPATVNLLIQKFTKNVIRLFDEMRTALDEMNLDEVFRLAHTLKGSSRSMGAIHMGDLWEKVQDLSKKGQLADIKNLATEIQTELDHVISELNSFVRQN